jgi:hypothetical protein
MLISFTVVMISHTHTHTHTHTHKIIYTEPGMVSRACNPRTWEVEAGE